MSGSTQNGNLTTTIPKCGAIEMPTAPPNFDPLARSYRWLEYLSLGPLLQRTRTHHLPALAASKQALLLGDGDGRFTAALLRRYPHLHAEAVDVSPAMLATLRRSSPAVTTTQADLRTYTPSITPDLITAHFVLDCLTQSELESLVARLVPRLAPAGLWLVSDFRIPPGPLHWPARLYIRALYLAFRILTGLRITRLPDHATPMRRAGLKLTGEHRTLFGLLTTQLWQK